MEPGMWTPGDELDDWTDEEETEQTVDNAP